ncbi:aminoacyl-tRNA hydrolase [Spirochaeta dissipatitropha]
MFSALIGLGNPGKKYEMTRHNIGWRIAEAFVREADPSADWKSKFKGKWTQIRTSPGSVSGCRILVPETFMNKAGESVKPFADFFTLEAEEIVVIHDDLELPFAEVQLRKGGGLGGHNGLRSIEQHLGTRNFQRLRIGIGRPVHGSVSSWVLSRFSPQEEAELEDITEKALALLR